MKVKELIDLVNNNSFYCADALIYNRTIDTNILEKIPKPIATIEYFEFKRYVQATVIYACEDGFVGVRGPVILKEPLMSLEDTNNKCYAKEYEITQIYSYKPKSDGTDSNS